MKRLIIDAEDFIGALQNGFAEFDYYLDLETGEVVFSCEEGVVEPDEELEKLLEEYPDRFLYIDAIPSSTAWRTMADFIEQLPYGEPRERLTVAVQLSHPFRRFKDTLLNYPALREQWFAFEYQTMLDVARKWLAEEDIDAELKTRVPDHRPKTPFTTSTTARSRRRRKIMKLTGCKGNENEASGLS